MNLTVVIFIDWLFKNNPLEDGWISPRNKFYTWSLLPHGFVWLAHFLSGMHYFDCLYCFACMAELVYVVKWPLEIYILWFELKLILYFCPVNLFNACFSEITISKRFLCSVTAISGRGKCTLDHWHKIMECYSPTGCIKLNNDKIVWQPLGRVNQTDAELNWPSTLCPIVACLQSQNCDHTGFILCLWISCNYPKTILCKIKSCFVKSKKCLEVIRVTLNYTFVCYSRTWREDDSCSVYRHRGKSRSKLKRDKKQKGRGGSNWGWVKDR